MARISGGYPEIIRKKVEREIGHYCEQRIPPHVRDKITIEYEIRGNSVTLVERGGRLRA